MRTTLFRICILAVLLTLALSACAPAAPQVVEKVVEKEVEKTVEVVVTATPEPVVVKPFKVAYINPSTNKDASYGQSMYDSLMKVQNEIGMDKLEFVFSESMYVVPDAAAAIRDYAASGEYDLVVAHSAAYGATVAETAPDFPDVSFAISGCKTTYIEEGVENVFCYGADAEYPGYLMGVMAGLMTKSGVIGFCGPVKTADNYLFGEGFIQGVKASNPNAKVNDIWTGSFADVPAMSACAETQLQAGADVLSGGSQASVGAVGIAQEKGVPYFYFQGDYSAQAPKAIVASATYEWSAMLKDIIKQHQAGIMGDKIYRMTLKNGGLNIVFNPGYEVPAEVKAAYDEALAKILSGEIVLDIK